MSGTWLQSVGLDMPARQSFVIEMVGRDDVADGVGLNAVIINASRIVASGRRWAMAFGGLAILAAAGGTWVLRRRPLAEGACEAPWCLPETEEAGVGVGRAAGLLSAETPVPWPQVPAPGLRLLANR